MSEEQLKAFLEAVKADAGLLEKLKGAADLDAAVAIAKEAGFVISAEELMRAQAEVSEEELEDLTGGGVLRTVTCATNTCKLCWRPTDNRPYDCP